MSYRWVTDDGKVREMAGKLSPAYFWHPFKHWKSKLIKENASSKGKNQDNKEFSKREIKEDFGPREVFPRIVIYFLCI